LGKKSSARENRSKRSIIKENLHEQKRALRGRKRQGEMRGEYGSAKKKEEKEKGGDGRKKKNKVTEIHKPEAKGEKWNSDKKVKA